ncbi:hypothetical protein L873DRAFT_1799304 [Choiromyces venosus 120613-1]|uniref:Tc1-like transposase DDE domain-containing protein n=1 Tax=Choiromyces venosus 120613-1 TaxID=1336337 RepID=A0A3N4K1F1_9PEZI|nr:hypothetical protein L873DRAFT_1799304 [Choiromyces venosus 120613-1]
MNIPHLYLVEDNAPSHQTARSVDKEERKEKGIVTLDWPLKSPDINQIEGIWDYEKDEISTWQFVRASKAVVDGAKAVLCQAFHEKLQRVIIHGGNNNFNG